MAIAVLLSWLALAPARAGADTITSTATPPPTYVALGDSVSAGNGTNQPDYDHNADNCYRSTRAYPYLLAKEWRAGGGHVAFAACSGATMATNLSDPNRDIFDQLGAVLGSQSETVKQAVQLVTVSAGANDLNWTGVMTDCYHSADCTAEVNSLPDAPSSLPGMDNQEYLYYEFNALFSQIKSDAPNAAVVAVGYPHPFFSGSASRCDINNTLISTGSFLNNYQGYSGSERAALNGAVDWFDGIEQAVAAQDGVTFLDTRPLFNGHEICPAELDWATDPSWWLVNPWGIPDIAGTNPNDFHPNQMGHWQIAQAIANLLNLRRV
jgi:lysophospholipase L1-like esterase